MSKSSELVADASLLFIALIWGSTFIIVKQAVAETPVFSFLFMRFSLAGVVLTLICLHKMKGLDLRVLMDGALMGLVLFLAYAFFVFGLTRAPASIIAFVNGLYVIIVPLLSSVLLRRLPRKEAVAGAFLAAAGLGLITLQSRFCLSFGIVFALMSATFFAVHIILVDKFSRRNDFILLTLVQINIVAFCALFLSAVYDPAIIPDQFDRKLAIAVLFTSLLATVLALIIQARMQKFTTPTKAAIFFITEAVSSLFFSYWLGGEVLTPRQYGGVFFIFLAMVLAELGTVLKRRRGALG